MFVKHFATVRSPAVAGSLRALALVAGVMAVTVIFSCASIISNRCTLVNRFRANCLLELLMLGISYTYKAFDKQMFIHFANVPTRACACMCARCYCV